MAVTSYHDLETSRFNRIRTKTLKRMHAKPTWHQIENMIQEYKVTTLDCETPYAWLQDYGLHVEIQDT